ncbi:hypothetical protein D3C76_1203030 [compost metagenome]
MQEIHVVNKLIDGLFLQPIGKKRAEPSITDLDPTDIQHRFQHLGIARVFAAHFAAGEPGQRHFADALLERILVA